SIELANKVLYGWSKLEFTGPGDVTFKTNGASRYNVSGWYNPIVVNKPGGSVRLLDDIPASLVMYRVMLTAGHLDLSNGNHTIGNNGFIVNNNNVRSLDLTNTNLTVSGSADF